MNQSFFNKLTPSKQSGLTLVELMVAMVISLLLIAGTITIFASNKQAYRLNEASSRVQENGRFAFDFIRSDVRMAGFLGCVGPSSGITVTNNIDTGKYNTIVGNANIENAIDGYDGINSLVGFSYATGTLPTGLSDLGLTAGTASFGDVITNTDALLIKRGDSCPGGKVVSPKDNANFKIADNSSCGIQQNDIVLVSNCESGDFFGVTNTVATSGSSALDATLATGSNINIDNHVSGNYGTDAEIFKLQTIIYYIGNGASGSPSLFKRNLVNGAFVNQELVEDVEDMTITYGVDTDGDSSANFYEIAANVTTANWANVVSARVSVDVRSGTQNVVQSAVANADRRLRHTFTETIKIRNRI